MDGVGYAVDGPAGRVEVVWDAATGTITVDVPSELRALSWVISPMSAEGIMGETESLDSSLSTDIALAGPLAGVELSADSLDFSIPFGPSAAATYNSSWEPASIMPRSGYWNLEMLVGAEYLSGSGCASGGSTSPSVGPAQIATSPGGWSFTLIVDGQYISAQRQALDTAKYVSGERPFQVQTADGPGMGVAVYEFDAVTPDRLEGTLTWDNHDGCVGTYPITIDLESPYDFIYDIPEPGMWQLQIDLTSTCGATVPTNTNINVDVTGGVGGVPALVHGGWLSLIVGENGILASLGSLLLPGFPALVEPAAPPGLPVPTSVLGSIHLAPTSPETYIGTFIGSPLGTPGCMVFGTVLFSRLG